MLAMASDPERAATSRLRRNADQRALSAALAFAIGLGVATGFAIGSGSKSSAPEREPASAIAAPNANTTISTPKIDASIPELRPKPKPSANHTSSSPGQTPSAPANTGTSSTESVKTVVGATRSEGNGGGEQIHKVTGGG